MMKNIMMILILVMLASFSNAQALHVKSDTLLGITNGLLNGDSLITAVWYLRHTPDALNRSLLIENQVLITKYKHSTGETFYLGDLHNVYMSDADTVQIEGVDYTYYDVITYIHTQGFNSIILFDKIMLDKEGRY